MPSPSVPSPFAKLASLRALYPVWIAALALIVLFPCLGTPGLWEPQEMAVADEAAARHDDTYKPATPATQCGKTPDPEGARTLTPRTAAWGLDVFATSDGGARLPFALLGFVGVMVVFGIGWRLGSARAGLLSGLVLMSFPLWAMSSRQLTNDLPTAVGGALMVYGMVALSRPLRVRAELLVLDVIVALVAIAAGGHLAFYGGGVLLGLIPPLAAIAVAGGFGLAIVLAALGRTWREIDRRPLRGAPPPWPEPARMLVALAAAVALGAICYWLARQVFDLGPLTVGTRQIAGKSILTSDCWSSALGGVWKGDDDLRATYDSLFEQIGFGMFPWAVLVPVALGALATGIAGEERRFGGVIVLGWAAAAWFAAAVWQRKVGFVIYGGFPACAVGVGLWLDAVIERRAALAAAPPGNDRARWITTAWSLIGLLVVAGVIVMAKDLSAFPERLTSLLVGNDQIKYPPNARFLGASMKAWLWVIGLGVALPLAFAAWLWRPGKSALSDAAGHGLTVALVVTALAALFWTHAWHRGLSENLSSKHVFQVYRDVKKSGEPLGIMGAMGNAPRYYAGGPTQTLGGREQVLEFLRRDQRVFALVPAAELCPIHAARSDHGYFVLDDTNAKWLLLSNQLGGMRDKNPLVAAMTQTPPKWLTKEVDLATWDNQVKLVGVRMPARVARGDKFTVTLVFKVIAPISGSWKVLGHFDLGGSRFQGDHDPIRGRCQTSYWKVGDYVIDTFEVEAGNASFPAGNYDVWVGFFTGSNPNWRNMTVTNAPEGRKDGNNRVKIGQVRLVSSSGCSAGNGGRDTGILAGLVALGLLGRRRRRRSA